MLTHASGNSDGDFACLCNNYSTSIVPPYVSSDYYCESTSGYIGPVFHFIDPLWDGQQCVGGEAPCCTHLNMPWFLKTLNETTIEDIELRLCIANNIPTRTNSAQHH